MAERVYYGKAVSANDYRNNGGTVVQGGTVPAGRPITNVPDVSQVLGHHSGKHGCVVPGPLSGAQQAAGVPGATAAVNDSGNFATLTAGQYVIRRNCSQLAGVANTMLQSGGNAAGAHHSIHFETTRRTVRIASWDYVTGTPTYESPAVSSDDFIVSGSGTDDAAVPTQAVPGELCYLVTGATPTTDEYAPRTLM